MSHTPEPWTVSIRESSAPGMGMGIVQVDVKAGDRTIAGVMVRPGLDAVANAHVMAAGPELLAACKEFVRKVEDGEAKSTRSYRQMKAAIAKATTNGSEGE